MRYWNGKKQTGIEIDAVNGRRHIGLLVNYTAWIDDLVGNGEVEMEKWIYEIDEETERSLQFLERNASDDRTHWTIDNAIEKIFEKYNFQFWYNEDLSVEDND